MSPPKNRTHILRIIVKYKEPFFGLCAPFYNIPRIQGNNTKTVSVSVIITAKRQSVLQKNHADSHVDHRKFHLSGNFFLSEYSWFIVRVATWSWLTQISSHAYPPFCPGIGNDDLTLSYYPNASPDSLSSKFLSK